MTPQEQFLSNVQMYSAYSRLTDNGKKESFDEMIDRVLHNENGLFSIGKLTDEEKNLIEKKLKGRVAFGSARYLWIGGTEWLGRNNSNHFAPFNCISMKMNHPEVFGYSMNLGMQGCGVGQVLELECIDQLPNIISKINLTVVGEVGQKKNGAENVKLAYLGKESNNTLVKLIEWFDLIKSNYQNIEIDAEKEYQLIVVGDSRMGWVNAYQSVIDAAYGKFNNYDNEINIILDVSNVRGYGERLKGFGGVSNPVYLKDFFINVAKILNGAYGRKLTSLEVMLVLEESAKNTVSGNIRRVAGMKQGNPQDNDFITAKDNLWICDDGKWKIDPKRDALRMSNHTAVYHTIPSLGTIKQSVTKQFYSGEGAIQYAPEAIARANVDLLDTPIKKSEFIKKYLHSKDLGRAYLSTLWMVKNDSYDIYRSEIQDEIDHRMSRYGLNPCVTGDTWVHTESGARQVKDLIGEHINVYVNGQLYSTTRKGFFSTGIKQVYQLTTKEGYSIKLTPNHQLLRVQDNNQEWIEAGDLSIGDKIAIHDHQAIESWDGEGTENDGYTRGKNFSPPDETASYEYYRGFFKGFLERQITATPVIVDDECIMFSQAYIDKLSSVQQLQRMLLRVGVLSSFESFSSGYMLRIVESSLVRLLEVCNYTIAELLTRKGSQLDEEKLAIIDSLKFKPQPFIAEIRSIIPLKEEMVYDCTVPEVSCFDANGFVAHNCAEVIGTDFRCNLGTVHLSQVGLSLNEQIDAFKASALQVAPLLHLDVDIPRFKRSHALDPIVLVSATQVNQWFIDRFGTEWVYWWLDGRPNNEIGLEFKKEESNILTVWRKTVEMTVQQYCERNGLKVPNRCTGFKPEGSLSWLSGNCGFSGIHFPPSGSLIYIRRKTFLRDDPIALAAIDYGYPVVPSTDCKNEHGHLLDDPFDPRVTSWLVEIPVRETILDKYPELSQVNFNKISATAQFDWVIQMQKHYSGHNTSCTINFREDEIEGLSQAIHKAILNNEGYISAALLARFESNETFPRLPFEPITEDKYNELMSNISSRRKRDFMGNEIDFEVLVRQRIAESQIDFTSGEVACSSEICELPKK